MYIWTTGQEILNLDNYKKVDIYFLSSNNYLLRAGDSSNKITTIASFDNQANAMYAQCLLFKGLMEGAKAWDASAVPLLSDIWEDIKENLFPGKNIPINFINDLEISVTGLDEVTLRYPEKWKDHLGSSLEDYNKEIGPYLEDRLSVDIKWKVQ
jgi:hypothetical protein